MFINGWSAGVVQKEFHKIFVCVFDCAKALSHCIAEMLI